MSRGWIGGGDSLVAAQIIGVDVCGLALAWHTTSILAPLTQTECITT